MRGRDRALLLGFVVGSCALLAAVLLTGAISSRPVLLLHEGREERIEHQYIVVFRQEAGDEELKTKEKSMIKTWQASTRTFRQLR